MEDELDVLVKDLYGKYAPNQFSEDKVEYVRDNYKDDVDVFIRDFYGKYAPKDFNEDKLKKIKTTYNLSLKQQEVIKPTQALPEKKNQIQTEESVSTTQMETMESPTPQIPTVTISDEELQRPQSSTELSGDLLERFKSVSTLTEDDLASVESRIEEGLLEEELKRAESKQIPENESFMSKVLTPGINAIKNFVGGVIGEDLRDVNLTEDRFVDKTISKTKYVASKFLFGDFLGEQTKEAEFILSEQGIDKSDPEYNQKLEETAKQLKREEISLQIKQQKQEDFIRSISDEEREELARQYDEKYKGSVKLSEEFKQKVALNEQNIEQLSVLYQSKADEFEQNKKAYEDLKNKINNGGFDLPDGSVDQEAIRTEDERLLPLLENGYTELTQLGENIDKSVSLYKKTYEEYFQAEEEVGDLEQELDMLSRRYGFFSRVGGTLGASGVSLLASTGATIGNFQQATEDLSYMLTIDLVNRLLGGDEETEKALTNSVNEVRRVLPFTPNSETLLKDAENNRKISESIREKIAKPKEFGQSRGVLEFLDTGVIGIAETTPLLLAAMSGAGAGSVAFGVSGAGEQYFEQVRLIEEGRKEYSPTNMYGAMAGSYAAQQFNFLGTRRMLGQSRKLLKSSLAKGKDRIGTAGQLRLMGDNVITQILAENTVNTAEVITSNIVNDENNPIFNRGLEPTLGAINMALMFGTGSMVSGNAIRGFGTAKQNKVSAELYKSMQDLNRRFSSKELTESELAEFREQYMFLSDKARELTSEVVETTSKLEQNEFDIINETDSKVSENKRRAIEIRNSKNLSAKEKKSLLGRLKEETKGLLETKESILNEAKEREGKFEDKVKELEDRLNSESEIKETEVKEQTQETKRTPITEGEESFTEFTESEIKDFEKFREESSLDEAMISELELEERDRAFQSQERDFIELKDSMRGDDGQDLFMFLHENLGRIKPEDFNKYGDHKIRKDMRGFNIKHASKNAPPLDTTVQALSEIFGREITPQDAINYIEDREANPEKYEKNRAKKMFDAKRIDTTTQKAVELYENLKYDKESIDAVNKLRGQVLSDAQADIIINRLKERNEQARKQEGKSDVTKQKPSEDIQRTDEDTTREKGQQDKLKEAEENLKNTFNEWFESKKNVGIIYDPKSQAAQDVKLTKAIIEYLKQLGIKGVKDIKKAVSDFSNKQIKLTDEQAKFLKSKLPKPKPKPRAKRQPLPKTNQEAVSNIKSLVEEYKAEGKDKVEFAKKAKKIIDNIREELTPSQYKRIAKRIADASKTKTPLQLERLGEYVSKAINDAEYSNNIDKANSLKTKIKADRKRPNTKFISDNGELQNSLRVDLEHPDMSAQDVKSYMEFLEELLNAPVFDIAKFMPKIQEYSDLATKQAESIIKEAKPPKETKEETPEEVAEKKQVIKNIRDLAKGTPKFENQTQLETYLRVLNIMDVGLDKLSLSELKTFREEFILNVSKGIPMSPKFASMLTSMYARGSAEKVKKAVKDKKFKATLTGAVLGRLFSVFSGKKLDKQQLTFSYVEANSLNELDAAIKGNTGRIMSDTFTTDVASATGKFQSRFVEFERNFDKKRRLLKGGEKAKRAEIMKITLIALQKAHDLNVNKIKGTANVGDFISSSRAYAEKNDKYRNEEFNDVEKIYNDFVDKGFVDSNGVLNVEKALKSLDSNTKALLEEIELALSEMSDVAKIASSLEGLNTPMYPYYVPLQVTGIEKWDKIDREIDRFSNPTVPYVPKSGNLIERTQGTRGKALKFDILGASLESIKTNLRSYYIRPEIKNAQATLDVLLKDPELSDTERNFFRATQQALKTVVNNLFVNDYFPSNFQTKFVQQAKSLGYQTQLSSLSKATSEFLTNTLTHALIANPKSFSTGVKEFATMGISASELKKIYINLGVPQSSRLFQKGGSRDQDLIDVNRSDFGIGGFRKLARETNEFILEAPDRVVALPTHIGAWKVEYKKLTGKELKMKDLLDNDFVIKNRKEIIQARKKADVVLAQGYASFNPFEGTLITTANKKDNIVKHYSTYMIRFRVTEANTFLSKGVDGLLGRNELSKREATALMIATVARMSSYTYLRPLIKTAMMTGISQGLAKIGVEFGLGEDEVYPDFADAKRAQRAVLSSIISLAFMRRMNNLGATPFNFAFEKLNEAKGDFLREEGEEYNPYVNALMFNSIRFSEQGLDSDYTAFLGAYQSLAKSSSGLANYTYMNVFEKDNMSRKQEERLNKQLKRDLAIFTSATLGVPLAGDLIALASHSAYTDLREKQNREKARRDKSASSSPTLMDAVNISAREKAIRANISKEDKIRIKKEVEALRSQAKQLRDNARR